MLSDACSPQVSLMPGTFLEHSTMPLLNLDTKALFNHMLINITHTSAPAPMMPTTYHNFSETTTPNNKQFLATALKLPAKLSHEACEPQIFENF